MNLKAHNSMGSNDIHPKILKKLVNVIKEVSQLFISSIGNGEVSVDWKLKNAIPVFKNRRKDPSNYRAVSCTLELSNIMEKIVIEFTEKLLKDNAVSSQSHQSFKKGNHTFCLFTTRLAT